MIASAIDCGIANTAAAPAGFITHDALDRPIVRRIKLRMLMLPP